MSERQSVTAGLFALTVLLLAMAYWQPTLWDVKLFEVILQGVVLTGLLNMVAAFHFGANKQNEIAASNTGKMADAVVAAANAGSPDKTPDATLRPGETAQALPDEDTPPTGG